jgi:uncharacterized membrane protein
MTENPGTTPPSGDEPSTPAAGQPTPPPAAPQPGAYPPPAAPGYGPAAGGYPPPPADPYGQQPPAQPYGAQQPYAEQPPGAPYAQPYAQQQPYGATGPTAGVGEAFNYGWTKFTQNVGPLILGVLAYVVAIGVISGIFFAILVGAASVSTDAYGNVNSGFGALGGFSLLLFYAVIALLGVFMQAGVIRATLEIVSGRPVEFATFFKFTDFGKVILAALLVGVGTGIGTILFVIPGIVFAFFAQFTLFFVIDKGLAPVDALKASFTLVNRNLGTVVLLFLGVYVAQAIGSFLCGVGVLVAIPVSLIATAFMYRRLQNEPVAA